ncbi:MAG: dihydroorotate dehydrogenase electron transfer subunit [Planctomycetota bacterium]|jgi:dihydroorotate dehydrogenase electron transfer subunit
MAEKVARKRGVFLADVAANSQVCEEHYRLTVALKAFPPSRPGQFIQLLCRRPGEHASFDLVDWPEAAMPKFAQPELTEAQPLLRRPLSIAGRRDGAGGASELDLIYRVVGTGTRWLTGVRPGEPLSVLGPLGNAFTIRSDRPQAALVGGGVGIPPMLYLAEALVAAGREVTALTGASRKALLPLSLTEGAGVSGEAVATTCVGGLPAAVKAIVATDDGSLGFKGFVSEAFDTWLGAQGLGGDDLVVYCCGPEALMEAVGNICLARGIECQLAMERYMACGMGTCQSCNVKIRDPAAPKHRGWSYKLCCTDGPVFDASELIW